MINSINFSSKEELKLTSISKSFFQTFRGDQSFRRKLPPEPIRRELDLAWTGGSVGAGQLEMDVAQKNKNQKQNQNNEKQM